MTNSFLDAPMATPEVMIQQENHLISIISELVEYEKKKGGHDLYEYFQTLVGNHIGIRNWVFANDYLFLNIAKGYAEEYGLL